MLEHLLKFFKQYQSNYCDLSGAYGYIIYRMQQDFKEREISQ